MATGSIFSTIAQQCVNWVRQITGLPGGPGAAAGYAQGGANSPLANAGYTQLTDPTKASAGDVIVYQPGVLGVGSAGHIVSLAGFNSNGDAIITQANSAGSSAGSPPTVGTIAKDKLSTAGLSFWAPPANQAAQNASNATAALTQLGGDTSQIASGGATQATGYKSLGTLLGDVGGPLGGIPVLGGVIKGASAPFVFMGWASQRRVWGTALIVSVGGYMVYRGSKLLIPGVTDAVTAPVRGAAGVVRTGASLA